MNAIRRRMFRAAAALNNFVYRASGGRLMGRIKGIPVLLLTVAGRESGRPITTPVVYLEQSGRYVVSGSAGGQDSEPQWFRNLRATDRARIEVGRKRYDVDVKVLAGPERDEMWQQLVAFGDFFAGYQRKTSRVIGVAELSPR